MSSQSWKYEIVHTTTPLPSSSDNTALEWLVRTTENEQLDPRLFLLLDVKITHSDGKRLGYEGKDETDPKVYPVSTNLGVINNFLMSMFKTAVVEINGQSATKQ